MTRAELIQATKVKLEEISPFEEPSSFIIAAGDTDYDKVKPITSYIDDTLDKAGLFCLQNLPATLLADDIFSCGCSFSVTDDGVGWLLFPTIGLTKPPFIFDRFVRISNRYWKRDCTTFITTADPLYLLQQNKHTRGGTAKPIAVVCPEQHNIELYSFPKSMWGSQLVYNCVLHYISIYPYSPTTPALRAAETIISPIGDYIALQCAAMVCDIMGNPNQAEILRQQYNRKLEDILH